MHPDAYQKLHEFNLHIRQGVDALHGMGALKEVSRKESSALRNILKKSAHLPADI